MSKKIIILGAGMTGIAAGMASQVPIYESEESPGGICSSYYIRSGEKIRHSQKPMDQEAYRFEIGGGHWIFGGSNRVLNLINRFVTGNRYKRRSSVYFSNTNLYVPYPLQNHLRYLGPEKAKKALSEMSEQKGGPYRTMEEWLSRCFGSTLCDLFFFPFHELYTAGLYTDIAPQDTYKSPVDLKLVTRGASRRVAQVGYNVSFLYPDEGLNTFAQRMASDCDVRYDKAVVKIDVNKKMLFFHDSTQTAYDSLICTLPLNKVVEMCGIQVNAAPDPCTSVLVLNIGAVRGNRCPDDHWLYIPDSSSGFHRVGFYSNVDPSFLPASVRVTGSRVSIYVERAFPENKKPSPEEVSRYICDALKELQEWGFIVDTEVVDHTWIDIAYTWSWPGSNWRAAAINALKKHHIHQIGRYGTWRFQGIADSIDDGLKAGVAANEGTLHL